MQNEKSVLPNIYKWIAENPEYCSINSNTLTYKFLGFLDEIYGFYCNICPEAPENEIAKMACAEVIMEDTGKQVICHEIPLPCLIALRDYFSTRQQLTESPSPNVRDFNEIFEELMASLDKANITEKYDEQDYIDIYPAKMFYPTKTIKSNTQIPDTTSAILTTTPKIEEESKKGESILTQGSQTLGLEETIEDKTLPILTTTDPVIMSKILEKEKNLTSPNFLINSNNSDKNNDPEIMVHSPIMTILDGQQTTSSTSWNKLNELDTSTVQNSTMFVIEQEIIDATAPILIIAKTEENSNNLMDIGITQASHEENDKNLTISTIPDVLDKGNEQPKQPSSMFSKIFPFFIQELMRTQSVYFAFSHAPKLVDVEPLKVEATSEKSYQQEVGLPLPIGGFRDRTRSIQSVTSPSTSHMPSGLDEFVHFGSSIFPSTIAPSSSHTVISSKQETFKFTRKPPINPPRAEPLFIPPRTKPPFIPTKAKPPLIPTKAKLSFIPHLNNQKIQKERNTTTFQLQGNTIIHKFTKKPPLNPPRYLTFLDEIAREKNSKKYKGNAKKVHDGPSNPANFLIQKVPALTKSKFIPVKLLRTRHAKLFSHDVANSKKTRILKLYPSIKLLETRPRQIKKLNRIIIKHPRVKIKEKNLLLHGLNPHHKTNGYISYVVQNFPNFDALPLLIPTKLAHNALDEFSQEESSSIAPLVKIKVEPEPLITTSVEPDSMVKPTEEHNTPGDLAQEETPISTSSENKLHNSEEEFTHKIPMKLKIRQLNRLEKYGIQPNPMQLTKIQQHFNFSNVIQHFLCHDYHHMCKFWAENDECVSNPFWMRINCQRSCDSCGETQKDLYIPKPIEGCYNHDSLCPFWWFNGECKKNPTWMRENCRLSCVCIYDEMEKNRSTFYIS
uniref:ShKT domain-containing protein n=1 Tax=Acrobeloides nanus TaxID=290746 RepID=A0A914CDM1_9BILA